RGSGSRGNGGSGKAALIIRDSGIEIVTGGVWQKNDKGDWQYKKVSNSLATGWNYISSPSGTNWYHFDENGTMDSGWYLDTDGRWYYLEVSGSIQGAARTGWHYDALDGRIYYLDPVSCAMVTGWNQIDGVWYYFTEYVPAKTGWNQDSESGQWVFDGGTIKPLGSMWQETETPDGYIVNENGAWVQR
ncbi:MAG: hypothetical protein Q4D90_10380, partial [bacterium]|nr:hypothetical protein [bacterium]